MTAYWEMQIFFLIHFLLLDHTNKSIFNYRLKYVPPFFIFLNKKYIFLCFFFFHHPQKVKKWKMSYLCKDFVPIPLTSVLLAEFLPVK